MRIPALTKFTRLARVDAHSAGDDVSCARGDCRDDSPFAASSHVATMTPRGCSDCVDYGAESRSAYDHVHTNNCLPEACSTGERLIEHGYAVRVAGMDRGLPHTWVFFLDLDPALVFGLVGEMSAGDIANYGVHEAARDITYDKYGEIRTLHVNTGVALDRQGLEADAIARWVAGLKT
jgi:hypothetical protein